MIIIIIVMRANYKNIYTHDITNNAKLTQKIKILKGPLFNHDKIGQSSEILFYLGETI